MSFFDNLKVMKDSIAKTANNISSNIATTTMEQSNLNRIYREIDTIDMEIEAACTQIGREFLEYVLKTKEMPGIDVSDILAILGSKMTRKANLEVQIIEIQKRLKDQMIIQEKMREEEGYKREKEKLDMALAVGVISKVEYDEKLIYYKKRLDSFDEIKRIEEQYEFDIITREERDIKIDEIRYR